MDATARDDMKTNKNIDGNDDIFFIKKCTSSWVART